MGKIKVAAYSVSLDGFGAGPSQSLEHPLGRGAEALHTWMLHTKMFHTMTGKEGGSDGKDNEIATRSMKNIGAWIMGRNMFGPVRGPWLNDDWRGWWGNRPPYEVPVFVLTHHARPPLEMEGVTVFHFVTEGLNAAVQMAQSAAGEKDIRIGGGASTIRQCLQAGYIDELQFSYAPVFLGRGEPVLDNISLIDLGFTKVDHIMGEQAVHIIATK